MIISIKMFLIFKHAKKSDLGNGTYSCTGRFATTNGQIGHSLHSNVGLLSFSTKPSSQLFCLLGQNYFTGDPMRANKK